jgi:hypothetical protein
MSDDSPMNANVAAEDILGCSSLAESSVACRQA